MRAPLVLLSAALGAVAGCAREGTPPGGPPDRLPPIIISSEPDTFSMVEPFRSPVTFRFSERISERPGAGTLDQSVVVSPVSGEVRVSHGREGLSVRVLGGFEAGRVYRLTVLPVIQDMFGNSLQEPYELFFSTGPEFTSNVVAGSVIDRISGDALRDVRVDAAVAGSDLVHTSVTDSAGIFAMRYLPPGDYVVSAYLDRNRNGEPDFSEPQGTHPAALRGDGDVADTVIVLDVPLLPSDTTAAQLARVTVEDSVSLLISFDDYLDPDAPLEDVRVTVASDTVDAAGVVAVVREHEAEAYRRARADSIARERAARDRADAPAPAETMVDPPPAPAGQDAAGTPDEEPERPRPQQTLVVILEGALVSEVLYQVEVSGITNINGVADGGGTAAVTRPAPEAVAEDTIQAEAGDTIQAASDDTTQATPGDTIQATPGDTIQATPDDTIQAEADSVPRDTVPPPPGDTIPRDTVAAPPSDDVAPMDTAAPGDTARRDTIQVPPNDASPRGAITSPLRAHRSWAGRAAHAAAARGRFPRGHTAP